MQRSATPSIHTTPTTCIRLITHVLCRRPRIARPPRHRHRRRPRGGHSIPLPARLALLSLLLHGQPTASTRQGLRSERIVSAAARPWRPIALWAQQSPAYALGHWGANFHVRSPQAHSRPHRVTQPKSIDSLSAGAPWPASDWPIHPVSQQTARNLLCAFGSMRQLPPALHASMIPRRGHQLPTSRLMA